MTKPLAILGLFLTIGLLFAELSLRDTDSIRDTILHSISSVEFALSVFMYCGFATLHAVQRVSDPAERAGWVLLTVGQNFDGSCNYYLNLTVKYNKRSFCSLVY